MRYEVLIMMAVVGAINVIGRIMAKRAKDRLAAEQAEAIESHATPKPAAKRREVVPPPPGPVSTAIPATAVAKPPVAAVAQTKSVAPVAIPRRSSRLPWSARRMRDGLVASEILGPPISLRK